MSNHIPAHPAPLLFLGRNEPLPVSTADSPEATFTSLRFRDTFPTERGGKIHSTLLPPGLKLRISENYLDVTLVCCLNKLGMGTKV